MIKIATFFVLGSMYSPTVLHYSPFMIISVILKKGLCPKAPLPPLNSDHI